MFMYTVYPIRSTRRRKKSGKVEPVSRINPVHPVIRSQATQYSFSTSTEPIPEPHGAADSRDPAHNKYVKKATVRLEAKQTDGEWPENDLFVQKLMPVLLAWRYTKPIVRPDYIRLHTDRLYALRLKRGRREK